MEEGDSGGRGVARDKTWAERQGASPWGREALAWRKSCRPLHRRERGSWGHSVRVWAGRLGQTDT